jgi:hypothetical protein
MSIKNKSYTIPPEDDDYPIYNEDTLCWGCDKLFDCIEIRCDSELCYKCHSILNRKEKKWDSQ